MNLLDFSVDAAVARLGDASATLAAEDGVELAESELIGLAPLAAFLAVADHADAPPDDPIEARLAAAARLPPAAGLLPATGARAPARGRARPRRPDRDAAWALPRHRGRPRRRRDARAS